ncbi:DsbA family protein [Comamonas sp. GB3 AK4-5]|uniref:DsbA family protein n=1 Tax=Comamonas sp. GB3 AK4-5 TaxID=3231487 RepID=UPI00351DD8F6
MSTTQPTATLHYIFDPLCGWCYAAAPLVDAARQVPGLQLQWHAGGMLAGAQAKRITADWRAHVLPHDQRIHQLTGQPFGEAYTDGLLNQVGTPLDSGPPITALLAVQAMEQPAGTQVEALDLLHRIQQAHYVQGRTISDADTLQQIAAEAGLDPQAFAVAYISQLGDPTLAHIQDSRHWLQQVGGQGFPTWALEWQTTADTAPQLQAVDASPFLGQASAWQDGLQRWLAALAA